MEITQINFPEGFKSFRELTKKEAELYFEWFIGQIPSRILALNNAICSTNELSETLDFSPASLQIVWEWFVQQIVWTPKNELEIEMERNLAPSITHSNVLNEKISEETLSLIFDISIYFGETFIRNYPTIYWGKITSPKSFVSLNRPVLLGFRKSMVLDPTIIVNYLVIKNKKNNNSGSLFELYTTWSSFV